MRQDQVPGYLTLMQSGELAERARRAAALLDGCRLCPCGCGASRLADEHGACGVGRFAVVAGYGPHFGEESCLRGHCGSGTIFLSGCNLQCVFCQNWDISHRLVGDSVTPGVLAGMMLELQDHGCHNINWVTPTHVLPQLLEALVLAAEGGLRLPIVYNSSGYDRVETLRLLEGIVDIYLPDFKFWDPGVAAQLTRVPDYPEVARRAVAEMHRQVGDLVVDDRGVARRGLLVRHLVMPRGLAGTGAVAAWLANELSPHMRINIMGQYHPEGLAALDRSRFAEIARPVTASEIRQARAQAQNAGLAPLQEG